MAAERGVFVLSLDTELVWGSFDHTPPDLFAACYPDVRGAIRELLGLLERHRISATWAVVGHLFLNSCERGPDARPHPECERPAYKWYDGDWLGLDPCTDRVHDPLWYGDDILEWLQRASVPQEIGSHSFSHVIFGDEGCSGSVARSELRACLELAQRRNLRLRSFVFPRNLGAHHDALREFGFTAFRGDDPTWYRRLPLVLRRAAHFVDQAIALAPPVTQPYERLEGLWDIPGSMLWLPRTGIRRFIPMASRIRKAKRGLHEALHRRRVFHLWLHPFNLCVDRRAMIDGLDEVLAEAARLRERGELDILTMGGLAERLGGVGRGH